MVHRLVLLLYPHKCFLCERVLEGDGWICAECGLPRTDGMLCPVCGKETDNCLCGRMKLYYCGAAVPLFYTDGVRHGIHRFKYSGRRYYAPFLAKLMAESIRERFGACPADLITYVPLDARKLHTRGFCQTELLARELSKLLGLPVRDGLIRHTGRGAPQVGQKNFAARQNNARTAFERCEGICLAGERVLLVDDVITSGATMRRCSEQLLRLGASEVMAAAVATTRLRRG